MACSRWPPAMRSGGQPSSESMRAPIRASGSMTRRIGRFDNDGSPTSTLSKACPASRPASNRIAVPALPQSSGTPGGRRPSTPTPCTTRMPGSGASMRTPNRANTAAVARVSSPSRNPSMRDTPSAIAASMIARCDTDLSPGTTISPPSGPLRPATQSRRIAPLIAPPRRTRRARPAGAGSPRPRPR
jgi:hypothetical protein